MQPFTEKVVQIIRIIPPGKVMTYGQIAKLAGNPRGARQVVRILHSLSRTYGLPWHRVINAKGEVAIHDEGQSNEQMSALKQEGIEFDEYDKVDLTIYRFDPEWNDVDLI
ncbi:MGMT family protein [Pseudalkalibacillus salsuginis]|uniref:MGMT family protein n=1 Tax=Pseudalkalibacillus salsuginis TaxID=2910972 RepID=UPI001F39760C|nr:MGMT family protein [Pseudalkalibacillus salsuginis]MCF6411713.1 MGMT family protein [Pseudalkalibacillus salsuginis]